tara:strand:- start:1371 stop:1577 length:207 start_codon:yes stop_codon:yes gene_type:complete
MSKPYREIKPCKDAITISGNALVNNLKRIRNIAKFSTSISTIDLESITKEVNALINSVNNSIDLENKR